MFKTSQFNIALSPIVKVPHDQYSYINLLLPKILNMLGERKTLWLVPGGSLDLLLVLYNYQPDLLEWLNIYIVEIDKEIYDIYESIKVNANEFYKSLSNNSNNRVNVNSMNIHKLSMLLNKTNIHIKFCDMNIDKFLSQETIYGDDDLVFINTSTRNKNEEFNATLLLNIAYERLIMGLPTMFTGCHSNLLNKELEGSATDNNELFVDKHITSGIKIRATVNTYNFY